jgi:hypothetical protein
MTATEQRSTQTSAVAACTAAAAHRRDHRHSATDECHPHQVEVVRLGVLALAVCHDCASDSGFVPEREAELISLAHRRSTMVGTERMRGPTAA